MCDYNAIYENVIRTHKLYNPAIKMAISQLRDNNLKDDEKSEAIKQIIKGGDFPSGNFIKTAIHSALVNRCENDKHSILEHLRYYHDSYLSILSFCQDGIDIDMFEVMAENWNYATEHVESIFKKDSEIVNDMVLGDRRRGFIPGYYRFLKSKYNIPDTCPRIDPFTAKGRMYWSDFIIPRILSRIPIKNKFWTARQIEIVLKIFPERIDMFRDMKLTKEDIDVCFKYCGLFNPEYFDQYVEYLQETKDCIKLCEMPSRFEKYMELCFKYPTSHAEFANLFESLKISSNIIDPIVCNHTTSKFADMPPQCRECYMKNIRAMHDKTECKLMRSIFRREVTFKPHYESAVLHFIYDLMAFKPNFINLFRKEIKLPVDVFSPYAKLSFEQWKTNRRNLFELFKQSKLYQICKYYEYNPILIDDRGDFKPYDKMAISEAEAMKIVGRFSFYGGNFAKPNWITDDITQKFDMKIAAEYDVMLETGSYKEKKPNFVLNNNNEHGIWDITTVTYDLAVAAHEKGANEHFRPIRFIQDPFMIYMLSKMGYPVDGNFCDEFILHMIQHSKAPPAIVLFNFRSNGYDFKFFKAMADSLKYGQHFNKTAYLMTWLDDFVSGANQLEMQRAIWTKLLR